MTAPTRTIYESDVHDWWLIGWTYVGPADDQRYAIMRWDNNGPPVQPLQDEEFTALVGACAALEGAA